MKTKSFIAILFVVLTGCVAMLSGLLVSSTPAFADDGGYITADDVQTAVYSGEPISVEYTIENLDYEQDELTVSYVGTNVGNSYNSETPPTEVGEYLVTISVKTYDKQVALSVTQKEITGYSYSVPLSKTYSGNNKIVLDSEEVDKLVDSNMKLTGAVAEDDVSTTHTAAVFAGTGYGPQDVLLSGLALTGTKAKNYKFSDTLDGISGNISKLQVTVTAKNVSQIYGAVDLSFLAPPFAPVVADPLDENPETKERPYTVEGALPESEIVAFYDCISVFTNAVTSSVVAEYDLIVTISGAWVNYDIEKTNGVLTVNRANITAVTKNTNFPDKTVIYNAKEQKIELTGYDPTEYKVVYAGNKGTDAGIYQATATITKNTNYNSLVLKATLTINSTAINSLELKPTAKVNSMTAGISPEAYLVAKAIDEEDVNAALADNLSDTEKLKEEVKAVYRLTVMIGALETFYNGNAEVSIKIPDSVSDKTKLRVVMVASSGTLSPMKTTINGDYVTFSGSPDGVYAVIGEAPAVAPTTDNAIDWKTIIIIGGVVAGLIVLAMLGSLKKVNKARRRKRRRHSRYA